jgi:GrpB-like predicted nucleotidyltransferase (UPF0157 family)
MDEVKIEEYNPSWPAQFRLESTILRRLLGDRSIVEIEHIGSTAVPGLAAKPIVDIMIAVPSLSKAIRDCIPIMESLDYAYWSDNPNSDRMFFVKGLPPNGPRTFHVHMVERKGELVNRLLFRDYLRINADEAARYEKLKRNLANQFPGDRDAYTQAKTEYIVNVTRMAKESAEQQIAVPNDR